MVDFEVPANPGWGARFREKHGTIEDDVQVVSPAFRRAIQKGRLRAQLIKAASEASQEVTISDPSAIAIIADRELTAV